MLNFSRISGLADRFARESASHLPQQIPAGERWYKKICSGTGYDVWLIRWIPGSETGLHDHGSSTGAVRIISGALHETRWLNGHLRQRVWTSSITHLVPKRCIHNVFSPDIALSVHVYSPALKVMTYYSVDDKMIVPESVQQV